MSGSLADAVLLFRHREFFPDFEDALGLLGLSSQPLDAHPRTTTEPDSGLGSWAGTANDTWFADDVEPESGVVDDHSGEYPDFAEASITGTGGSPLYEAPLIGETFTSVPAVESVPGASWGPPAGDVGPSPSPLYLGRGDRFMCSILEPTSRQTPATPTYRSVPRVSTRSGESEPPAIDTLSGFWK